MQGTDINYLNPAPCTLHPEYGLRKTLSQRTSTQL